MPHSVFFIMPGDRSDSMKNVTTISPKLGSFNFVLKERKEPNSFEQPTILDDPHRCRKICLYRRKFQIPAPRVWNDFEYLLHAPPRYIYNVWADSNDFPEHWWAGEAELEVFTHRGKN